MELTSGVCTFCERTDSILKTQNADAHLNLARNALFANGRSELSQFQKQKANLSVCVLCAYRIEIANAFTKQYKKTIRRKLPRRQQLTHCIVCDSTSHIIAVNSDPCGFCSKLQAYMQAVNSARDYKQHVVCTYCVFALNTWCDIWNTVNESILKQNDILLRPSPSRAGESSAIKQPLKLTFSYCGNGKMRVRQKNSISPKLQNHLKECLKDHKPLKKNKKIKLNYKLDDVKILEKVPYVLLSRKVTNKRLSQLKPSVGDKKKSTVLPIKIKMSPKFLSAKPIKKVKTPPKGPANKPGPKSRTKTTPKAVKKSPNKTPTPPKLKKTIYNCNICNMSFTRNFKYQQHSLFHVKPEQLVINVERCEFSKHKSVKTIDINQILNVTVDEQSKDNQINDVSQNDDPLGCDDTVENSAANSEEQPVNLSNEQESGISINSETNEVSNKEEISKECDVVEESRNSNDASQDNRINSTNEAETNGVCQQNGDDKDAANKKNLDGSGDDEDDEDSTDVDETIDSISTFLQDDSGTSNLKRKLQELNETNDSNEDSEIKYPPRKKVRFAFDLENEDRKEQDYSKEDDVSNEMAGVTDGE